MTSKSIRLGKGGSDDAYAIYVGRARAILKMWVRENGLGSDGRWLA